MVSGREFPGMQGNLSEIILNGNAGKFKQK